MHAQVGRRVELISHDPADRRGTTQQWDLVVLQELLKLPVFAKRAVNTWEDQIAILHCLNGRSLIEWDCGLAQLEVEVRWSIGIELCGREPIKTKPLVDIEWDNPNSLIAQVIK